MVYKPPNNRGTDERNSHRHEDQGLDPGPALHSVSEVGDSEANGCRKNGDRKSPNNCVSEYYQNLGLSKGPDVVVKTYKVLAPGIHEGKKQGANSGVNQADCEQKESWHQKYQVLDPLLGLDA